MRGDLEKRLGTTGRPLRWTWALDLGETSDLLENWEVAIGGVGIRLTVGRLIRLGRPLEVAIEMVGIRPMAGKRM